ncbi:MAG: glucosyltransferase domain-containing protein [Clostridia bacterium]|nr:glucosyltransferase domain-containing protein [Clostridia bacterium]
MKAKAIPYINYLKILGIMAIFALPLFIFECSTDTYVLINEGLAEYSRLMLSNGRVITALFFYLCGLIGCNVYVFYYISFTLSLVFSALAVYQLYIVLSGHFKKNTALILSFITVINPLSLEYFLFIEKGMFLLSILFITFAIRFYSKFLEGKSYYILLSSLFIMLSALIYQPLPALFVPIALSLLLVKSRDTNQLIVDTVWTVFAYGLGMGLALAVNLTVGSSSRAGGTIYPSNILKALTIGTPLISVLVFLGVLIALFAICIFTTKRESKIINSEVLFKFLKCSFIFLGTVLAIVLPFVFVNPEEVWLPLRIIYPLGALIGALSIFLLGKSSIFTVSEKKEAALPKSRKSVRDNTGLSYGETEGTNGKKGKALVALSAVFIAFTFCLLQAMFIGRVLNNKQDRELILKIGEEIAEYEKESGIEIKYISIYYDREPTKSNPFVLKLGDSNVRALTKSWSDVNAINYYLGKDYEKLSPLLNVRLDYETYNWDSFDTEQLHFVDNTLHLCVY